MLRHKRTSQFNIVDSFASTVSQMGRVGVAGRAYGYEEPHGPRGRPERKKDESWRAEGILSGRVEPPIVGEELGCLVKFG